MPLAPPVLQGLLAPLVTASGFTGQMAQPFVLAASNAIAAYLVTLTVKTNDTGVLGVGVGTGKVIVTPPQLIGPLLGAATANQLAGTSAPGLMTAIGNGVASFIASAGLVQSTHPGIGVGAGVGQLQIIGGPSPLQGQLMGMFSAQGFAGQNTPNLATAIAQGITQGLGTAQVIQVITGTPTVPPPVPGAGTGIGKLL